MQHWTWQLFMQCYKLTSFVCTIAFDNNCYRLKFKVWRDIQKQISILIPAPRNPTREQKADKNETHYKDEKSDVTGFKKC